MTGQTEALLVGGRAGVGKSSVGYEIHEQLSAAGIRHCLIEGDNLDMAYPAPWEHHLAERFVRPMCGDQADGDDRREVVKPLLERFTADAAGVVPLVALWAHGSLALGDYQPGRSDLDLVAVVSEHIGDPQRAGLERIHEALARDEELADKLHCSYVVGSELADAGRSHVTWAMGELYERPVSPISRRELRDGGLCLHGPEPGRMVPAITDQELADYVRADLGDYWFPITSKPALWLRDIWVDLGMLTLARASVTLRDGRLISKREALEVLADLDAPAEVVRDIYRRRYEAVQPISGQWRFRRAHLARTFVRAAIPRVLA